MKVIANKSKYEVLVEMDVIELRNLAGFNHSSEFDKAFGCYSSCGEYKLGELTKIENIPVSDIYQEAKDTLNAYKELRTKFESIRNQLTTLMGKIVKAVPSNEEKK